MHVLASSTSVSGAENLLRNFILPTCSCSENTLGRFSWDMLGETKLKKCCPERPEMGRQCNSLLSPVV